MGALETVKSAGKYVLYFAITIGVIGKVRPTLFLKLPMGFIPWAITGNIMPPYFDPTPFGADEFGTWAKDGDLIAAVGAKSGTNWMLYTTHQIRTKAAGNVETDYTDILLDTPWVGFNMLPGQRWGDTLLTSGIKTLMNTTVLPDGTKVKDYWDKPSHAFRIFKSHFTPEVLPIKAYPKVKFLAMARNGMDVVSSFYPFFAGHRPAFKGVWGGFPPTYGSPMECLQDFLPGGTLDILYFGYVKEWWPWRHEPNVLLLHYADAKKDLGAVVSKLAKFTGVHLLPWQSAKVRARANIKQMKKIAHKFDYTQWAGDGTKIMCGKDGCPGVDGALIRTGKLGGGKEFFTPEMAALWEAAVEKEFGSDPELKRWAAEGGRFS